MGGFRFATCDRGSALRFLQKLYPSSTVEDTPESAGPVLDLVEADLVRIPDPDFHPDGKVTPGENWDESRRAEVLATFTAFHEKLTAN